MCIHYLLSLLTFWDIAIRIESMQSLVMMLVLVVFLLPNEMTFNHSHMKDVASSYCICKYNVLPEQPTLMPHTYILYYYIYRQWRNTYICS